MHADLVEHLRPCWRYDCAERALTLYEWDEREPPLVIGLPVQPPTVYSCFKPPTIRVTLRRTHEKGSDARRAGAAWKRRLDERRVVGF